MQHHQSLVLNQQLPKGSRVGIVWSRFNEALTSSLKDHALRTLIEAGAEADSVIIQAVPGSAELPLSCQKLLKNHDLDGVIAIGVVIKGETLHFEYVCNMTAYGIMQVQLACEKPIAFCVLTTQSYEQALARAGTHNNKGEEAAITLVELLQPTAS